MRLLKLGIYHGTYLQNFYAVRPGLKDQIYEIQHRRLIEDFFGSSDFWTQALTKSGYKTADLIANAEFLQKKWGAENDLKFPGDSWLFEIAAAQIKKFRPDILLVADYSTFTADFLKQIRRDCPSIRLILGWCGAPYQNLKVFREWDIALSCVPEMVAGFRAEGIKSHHIDHAFAPRVLDNLNINAVPSIDFAFIGSVVRENKFHIERERLLLHLAKNTDLQIFSEIKHSGKNSFLRRKLSNIFDLAPEGFLTKLPFQRNFENLKKPLNLSKKSIEKEFFRRLHPPVFGLEMFQKLYDSRVVFNNHIDISPVSASNMRLFETTGVGSCLLTDWKKNLAELFEPDAEVLTYRSAEECVEKVNYILENESERRSIAEAGQRRTLRDHTFEKRAAQIDEIIRQALTSKT